MRTSFSLAHEARLIYAPPMIQLQAEHRHAAVLIDLLFKGACNLLLQLLCYTSRLLTSASKRLYNKRLIIIILMPYKK